MKSTNKPPRLKAIQSKIMTENGNYVCTIEFTQRYVELINMEDWDKTRQSWLNYRKSIKEELELEKEKQYQMAADMVTAYNEWILKSEQ